MINPIENITSFQTDWLASDPCFYNEVTGKVSRNINDVIDFRNLEFHPEGLSNYLGFGYSVFEQTPLKGVKFLRHSSALTTENGKVKVVYGNDPVESILGKTTREEDVLDLLRSSIQQWERSTTGNIVIPTSGGYDSRILNEMIADRDRIRSYTYGVSSRQTDSYEVVFASKIAEVLGTRWKQIPLGDFHHYFNDWDQLFGISTHAHGMYHMEFYHKILQQETVGTPLLSGIIGDAWAGSVNIPAINEPSDVLRLGYSHALNADPAQSLLGSRHELLQQYFEQNRKKLEDPAMRVVESMRFKIILLCYLMRVPDQIGFRSWTPFLTSDIALGMLNLPAERRQGRAWQVDYFRKKGLDVESLGLNYTKKNSLDRRALYQVPLKPLDQQLLRELINPQYVEWINKHILPTSNLRDWLDKMTYYPKVGGLLRRMGVRDEKLRAYNAYITLKPLETLLTKRNKA
ncbi:MAG: hypothetical protein ACTHMC_07930 [Pseudobacter sp.]|uniref:hypothetical protein n=1 Tax=Pseudobacter sp. TaxID=2045420 RepID=UPI003F808689